VNRPIHFEILGDDPAALTEFYKAVFGWEIATWGGPQGYWLATTGKDAPGIDGGFMERHFPQAVINTIQVGSLDDCFAAVKAAGGKVVNEPREVPGVGMHAYCADPEGNLFGLLAPLPDAG